MSIQDIEIALELIRKDGSLKNIVTLRHKLTEIINVRRYDETYTDEEQYALAVRNILDEMVLNSTKESMIDSEEGGLPHLKRAINLQNLSEKLGIVEEVVKTSGGNKIKLNTEMHNVFMNSEVFGRFNSKDQKIIKSAALGSAMLTSWRVDKLMNSIRRQAKRFL